MKTTIRYMFGALLATLTLAACSPEEYTGAEGSSRDASNYEPYIHVTVDQATNYVTFSYTATDGTSPVWILKDGSIYRSDFQFTSNYWRAGDYTVQCKIMDADGISANAVTRTFHVNESRINGFGGFSVSSDYNIAKTATASFETVNYMGHEDVESGYEWETYPNPTCNQKGMEFYLTLPRKTYEHDHAMFRINTDIALSAAQHYDFSIILTATKDLSEAEIQVGSLFTKKDIVLTANKPLCIWASDLEGVNAQDLSLLLYFGPNEADTEISIECMVIKDHADDDGTVLPVITEPEWTAVDSNKNLWNDWTYTLSQYYGYMQGRIQRKWDDFEVTQDGRTFRLYLPNEVAATNPNPWTARMTFDTSFRLGNIAVRYDFNAHLQSDKDITATIRMYQTGKEDNILFEEDVELKGGEDFNFWQAQLQAANAMNRVTLEFEFKGHAGDTHVSIADIIFQQSAEQ